jgi:hypothetical protein
VTGAELRQKVANIMLGWVGGSYQGANHREIISTWNNGKDAGQYTMGMSDPYCAATVSAAWIKAGIAGYIVKDTYCPSLIAKAKAKGIWVEQDGHVPQVGDAVLYVWSDGSGYASYDNTSEPDHVGMVVRVSGNYFTVAEGNMSGGKIGTREMQVNGRYIRGFICPDYDAIAAALGGEAPSPSPVPEVKTEDRYAPWRTWKNGSTEETVYKDSNLTQYGGYLDPGDTALCMCRYGESYMVTYEIDDEPGNWKVGWVGYDGGVS